MKNPTIYVITHYAFNHQGGKKKNLDPRFINSDKNYVYFLIDENCPTVLQGKKILYEKSFGPMIQEAGKSHFAEWSFLLAEAEYSFCEYPLFFISSRFYEKNHWLIHDLDHEWDRLFAYLDEYEYGVLPSYDRQLNWYDVWIDASLPQHKESPFSFHNKLFLLYKELYGVAIPEEYRYSPDFWCNYTGFRDRKALLNYVDFHKKIINYFFDENYKIKQPLSDYVFSKNKYRNEKPFTFILETYSKLFFYCEAKKYFGLHYDGYYEIDEKKTINTIILPFKITSVHKLYRFIHRYQAKLREKLRRVKTQLIKFTS